MTWRELKDFVSSIEDQFLDQDVVVVKADYDVTDRMRAVKVGRPDDRMVHLLGLHRPITVPEGTPYLKEESW